MIWGRDTQIILANPRPSVHPLVRGACATGPKRSICLWASKPSETQTGVCSKEAQASFQEVANTWNPRWANARRPGSPVASRGWTGKKSLIMLTKGMRVVVCAHWKVLGERVIGHCIWPWHQPRPPCGWFCWFSGPGAESLLRPRDHLQFDWSTLSEVNRGFLFLRLFDADENSLSWGLSDEGSGQWWREWSVMRGVVSDEGRAQWWEEWSVMKGVASDEGSGLGRGRRQVNQGAGRGPFHSEGKKGD